MPALQEIARRPGAASVGIVLGGGLWGLLWLPVRGMDAVGFSGAWPGVAMFLIGGVLMIPVLIARLCRH